MLILHEVMRIMHAHSRKNESTSMELTATDVSKIAYLARLAIQEDNIPQYADNLSKILEFVTQLNSVDTDAVEPMFHSGHIELRQRADEAKQPSNSRDKILALAPDAAAGLFVVPQVIEDK